MVTEITEVYCPYCGERIELIIDCSIDHQQYIEDCFVCCRPININATCSPDGELVAVTVLNENE